MAYKVKFETGQTVSFEKQPTPQDIDDVATNLGINKPKEAGVPKMDVPAIKPSTQQLKQEAATAQTAAKKENSVGGFLKNFGKALVSNIAPSEVGLGKTIAKTMTDPGQYATNVDTITTANNQLLKSIKEREGRGEDTTRLKQMYNQNLDLIKENQGEIDTYNKELPTTGQAVGQLGGTALDLLTAGTYGKATAGMKTGELATRGITRATLPQGIKQATQTPGLFTKAGAKAVGVGGGIGYASDVAQGLQGARGEDRTGANAFKPGMGTLIGLSIPTITGGIKSAQNTTKKLLDPDLKTQRIIEKRTQELDKIENNYATVRKQLKGNKGQEAKKLLASTDLLMGSVDDTGTMRTGAAIDELNAFIKPQEDVISQNLLKEGNTIDANDVKKALVRAINDSGVKGGAKVRALQNVEDDIAGYLTEATDGRLPIAMLHDAKVDKYANINYLNPESKRVDKIIAKTLKTLVEDNTFGVDVKSLNDELAQFYAVQGLLEKLDGRKIQGGKLGKYFAQTIGGIAGSHIGGPVGTIAGAELGGKIQGEMLKNSFAGKTGNTLKISDLMKSAVEKGKTPNNFLQLPARASGPKVINLPGEGILESQKRIK